MSASRVVVGVDGSPLSMAAVSAAAQIASERGLPLHVLHAFAVDLPMLGFGELTKDSDVVSTHASRLVAQGVARAHAIDPSLTVTTAVRDGYASQALVDAARTAALVVVGAMGHGLFSRASVGAVAMQVVTHARCPVLVVGHEGTPPASESAAVVVGVDGSKASLRALSAAFDEAVRRSAPLRVVHAWEPSSASDPTLSGDSTWSDYAADLERTLSSALSAQQASNPHVEVSYEVVTGEPVQTLLDHARRRRAARRGQPWFGRLPRAARRVDGAAPHGPQPLPGAVHPLTRRVVHPIRRRGAWSRRAGRARKPTPTRSVPTRHTDRCGPRVRRRVRCASARAAARGRWSRPRAAA
jgi:nucleotide-binding universal stress UspA family protein